MITAESIDVNVIKEMSPGERNKLKKSVLLNAIISFEESDITSLNTSIKALSQLVKGYVAEVAENSKKIVELNTENKLLQDNVKKLRTEEDEMSIRMNDWEQRSKINNIEIVGMRHPTESETDESLLINFCKDILDLHLSTDHFEAVHEVPSKKGQEKSKV